jgi:hypothetical protein
MTGHTGGITNLGQGQPTQTIPQKFILLEMRIFNPGGCLFPIFLKPG